MAGRRTLAAVVTLLAIAGCRREERQFRELPARAATPPAPQIGEIRPGGSAPEPPPARATAEERAYDVNEGKRLFSWFNCVGCHAHGGGGMGPALMNDRWIYGSEPENVYASIMEGRPNGMPSFRGKIPEQQVWQIVAYVRSLAGLIRHDVAPGRDDAMAGKKPESIQPTEPPHREGASH